MSVMTPADEDAYAASLRPTLRQLMTDKIWEMVGGGFGYSGFKPEFVHEKAFLKHHRFGRIAKELRELERFTTLPADKELVDLFAMVCHCYFKQM